MRVLADERMRGRLSGTAEYARAARYVEGVLRTTGAQPVVGGDLRVRFDATRPKTEGIALDLRGQGEHVIRLPEEQLCVLPGAGASVAPGPLPLQELGASPAGERRHVAWSEAGPLPGTSGVAAELSARYTEKRRLAGAAGAAALLILVPDALDSAEWRGWRTWCDRGELRPTPGRPDLPVIFMSREASTAVRNASTAGLATARVQLTRTNSPHSGINVIGRFGPPSAEAVVVTAHLDHIGMVTDDGGRRRPAPGAVDNASGVAALLELARRLGGAAPRSRTVIVAATDAEEAGLIGSTVLLDQLARAGLDVVANVNIDGATMMQHPLVDLVALGGKDSQLGDLAVAAGQHNGVEVTLEHTPVAGSDHAPFAQAGIPAVWLVAGTRTGVEGLDGRTLQDRWMKEVYHSPNDNMAQPLDFKAAARLVDVLESLVRRIANSEQQKPDWNDGTVWASRKRRPARN